jgi:hypothetical protein
VAANARIPRHRNLGSQADLIFLALNYYYHHSMRLPQLVQNKKPTVGFLARFFLKGFILRKSLPANNL